MLIGTRGFSPGNVCKKTAIRSERKGQEMTRGALLASYQASPEGGTKGGKRGRAKVEANHDCTGDAIRREVRVLVGSGVS